MNGARWIQAYTEILKRSIAEARYAYCLFDRLDHYRYAVSKACGVHGD